MLASKRVMSRDEAHTLDLNSRIKLEEQRWRPIVAKRTHTRANALRMSRVSHSLGSGESSVSLIGEE
jgi:hypothetical protein